MKKQFLLALIVLALLVAYAVTYQVRFDQTTLITTFGSANEESVRNAGEADESGLKFKWPYPINIVYTFDKRVQVMEDRPEELQTLDKHAIVVQTFLAWKITDPLAFYRTLGSVEEAQKQLREMLRDARKVIGANYSFGDLTNLDPSKLKLKEAEEKILAAMNEKLDKEKGVKPYGVELVSVGIKRVLLAASTTTNVFDFMRKNRETLAQNSTSEGESTANEIRVRATAISNTILSFADARAEALRAEGNAAAAKHYEVYKADEEFAVFLSQLETLEKMLTDTSKGKTTLILDAKYDKLFEGLLRPPGQNNPPAK